MCAGRRRHHGRHAADRPDSPYFFRTPLHNPMRQLTRSLVTAGLLIAITQVASAQTVAQEFEKLHFRSIGPATMSGRIADVAVYEANPALYYVGSAHGGVWKTTNNGATFEAQFQDNGLMAIGDVAISQINPDLVWVGTGESNNRQST